MKKVLFIFGIIATILTACEKGENVAGESLLKVTSNTEISVGYGNAQGIITYELINPVVGETVEAVANVEWINSFDYSIMGKIGYKVDANVSYEGRAGVITIYYGGQSTDITLTQSAKPRPEEVNIEVPYLLGHYYGDYAGLNYNYYLVFSEGNYDSKDSFYSAGYKYFIDIYSSERPEDYNNISVPNGVYTFNPDNDGRAGTFLESFSLYKEYDLSGAQIGEESYEEGTLTVTDDLVKLKVRFANENKLRVLTYDGEYKLLDRRSEAGSIY